jgi:hypothetical protein
LEYDQGVAAEFLTQIGSLKWLAGAKNSAATPWYAGTPGNTPMPPCLVFSLINPEKHCISTGCVGQSFLRQVFSKRLYNLLSVPIFAEHLILHTHMRFSGLLEKTPHLQKRSLFNNPGWERAPFANFSTFRIAFLFNGLLFDPIAQ